MARKARDIEVFGIYHIMQTSSDVRPLFENNQDRSKFLSILNNAKNRFGFKLFAYCLRNPQKYHLIIHANGSDLSKIMKSINIAYAMYVKSEGKLYKDRYKSILIKTAKEYETIKSEIETDWDGDNCFNSDPAYCDTSSPFEETCDDCIRTIEEGYTELDTIARKENLTVDLLLKSKEKRNALIVDFRKTSLLSLKDIGELFGGLSESTVCKILKKEL